MLWNRPDKYIKYINLEATLYPRLKINFLFYFPDCIMSGQFVLVQVRWEAGAKEGPDM